MKRRSCVCQMIHHTSSYYTLLVAYDTYHICMHGMQSCVARGHQQPLYQVYGYWCKLSLWADFQTTLGQNVRGLHDATSVCVSLRDTDCSGSRKWPRAHQPREAYGECQCVQIKLSFIISLRYGANLTNRAATTGCKIWTEEQTYISVSFLCINLSIWSDNRPQRWLSGIRHRSPSCDWKPCVPKKK